VGTHTLEPLSPITAHYPTVLLGILQIYTYLDGLNLSSNDKNVLFQNYLGNKLRRGELVNNEEAGKIRQEIENGNYSLQFQGSKNSNLEDMDHQSAFSKLLASEEDLDEDDIPPFARRYNKSKDPYGKYSLIHSELGIVTNKRVLKSWFSHIQRSLALYYGEVNFSKALLTELILNAPFLETITNKQDELESQESHTRYIEQSIDFARKFDPIKRLEIFDNYTQSYTVDWVKEEPIAKPTPGDLDYLKQVSNFSDRLLSGDNWGITDLYNLYQQSILTRGRIFKASAEIQGNKLTTKILPAEISSTSFDQIGGYDYQKEFYQNLLLKVERRDPRVEDIGLIIAAGEPGLGKSLGVNAFLSNLPENAKGVILETSQMMTERGKLPHYEMVVKLAGLHPEFEIFVVLEDMDTLATDRTRNPFTRQFLEIGSVIPDNLPTNMHIIGTTNRLDTIDKAVTRPGRAAKILIYETPKEKTDRMRIVDIHSCAYNYPLSEELKDFIVDKTNSFTPDEIRYIIWHLDFDEIKNPTKEDIERYIKEVNQKHKMVKRKPGLTPDLD
jgi:hypothetical protein